MIYQIRNPKVSEADKLVYLPNCRSTTMLQTYSLERKQLPIPSWLPTLPKDILSTFAYMLVVALVCLSSVLLASIFGLNDGDLVYVAVGTLVAVFTLQYAVGWYSGWASQFNQLAETLPAAGLPLAEVVSLQIMRQIDSDTFDRAVEVMSNDYNGIYGLNKRFCRAIDDYVTLAQPIVKREYSDNIDCDTPPAEVYSRYNLLTSSLRPLAENCLSSLKSELEIHEIEMIYM